MPAGLHSGNRQTGRRKTAAVHPDAEAAAARGAGWGRVAGHGQGASHSSGGPAGEVSPAAVLYELAFVGGSALPIGGSRVFVLGAARRRWGRADTMAT